MTGSNPLSRCSDGKDGFQFHLQSVMPCSGALRAPASVDFFGDSAVIDRRYNRVPKIRRNFSTKFRTRLLECMRVFGVELRRVTMRWHRDERMALTRRHQPFMAQPKGVFS